MDGGMITAEVGERRCPACGTVTFRNRCACGAHTLPVFRCPRCSRLVESDRCPACDAGTTCSQKVQINVRDEFADAMERCGVRAGQVTLVKGVKGMISRERAVEDLAKGVLRAKAGLYVFKDGTVRYRQLIDLPVTHVRPAELGVEPARLVELGTRADIDCRMLEEADQVVERRPQDILVSEKCGDWLVRVAGFVDDELERLYGLPPYYRATSPSDIIGRLLIGLAPHTSAGVLCRVVGYTKANVGYAHPFFHAAKRRNCFHGETEIDVWDYRTAWRRVPDPRIRPRAVRPLPCRPRSYRHLLVRSGPAVRDKGRRCDGPAPHPADHRPSRSTAPRRPCSGSRRRRDESSR